MKHIFRLTVPFLMAILLTYCGESPKEPNDTKADTENPETANTSKSNKFQLENNGINIVLPEGFKRISAAELELFLEANYSKKTLEYEKSRLRNLRSKEGQFYIYFNDESASMLTIHVSDPLSITNENGQGLLNMVTSIHTESRKKTNRKYEKITAGFSNNPGISIFRALYKVKAGNEPNPMFEHTYIITNEDETLVLNMASPEEINLDPYIEKFKF